MGRNSTGAWTEGEAKRIDLGFLIKRGLLQNGKLITGTLNWSSSRTGENRGCISFVADMTGKNRYLRLLYETTYNDTGEKKSFNYDIAITSVPSNLGKGEVLYFRCPNTGCRCRILYKAYYCDIWKSREAYTHRIYYDLQKCSKLDKYNTKYWNIENALCNRPRQRNTSTYRGMPTKRALKEAKMFKELELMDELRWSTAGMPKKLLLHAKEYRY